MTRRITHSTGCTRPPHSGTTSIHSTWLVAMAMIAAACGGAPDRPPTDTVAGESQAPVVPAAATPPPAGEQGRLALGGDIFNGRAAGGICFTCHGQNAVGTQMAPNLTDQTWIHGDGSVEFIANTIRTGVPQPKEYPAMMPPFAGMLTDDQIRAIAEYVYSLSRPGA